MKRLSNRRGFISMGAVEVMVYAGLAVTMGLWMSSAIRPFFRVSMTVDDDTAWRVAANALESPIRDFRTSTGLNIGLIDSNVTTVNPVEGPWLSLRDKANQAYFACHYWAAKEGGALVRLEASAVPGSGACNDTVNPPGARRRTVGTGFLRPTANEPLFVKDIIGERVVICRLKVRKSKVVIKEGQIPDGETVVVRRVAVRS